MPTQEVHQHVATVIYKAVEQLSPTQTAVIGGVGSTASAVSVLSSVTDGTAMAGLQYFTIAMGALGALLSVGLLLLKFVQQRREMTKWREENALEHHHFVDAHQESADDRHDLHEQIDDLTERCEKCGHHRRYIELGNDDAD